MKTKVLNIAEFQDVHVGHKATPTWNILNSLTLALPDNQTTRDLDIIFIAGDFFDHDLFYRAEEVLMIQAWIIKFLTYCAKHDIAVRILEGTPSHDWNQCEHFVILNEQYSIGCDLIYVKKLDIEHNEKFGIDILYVPDEWRPKCDTTWEEVKELLSSRGLSKVDFAIMHGTFEYQVPQHLKARFDMHRMDRYLGIVRYYIFVGHHHNQSSYDRILCAGSLDRLRHNEEETKGHYRVTVHREGAADIKFVENPVAKPYLTITVDGMDSETVHAEVTKVITKYGEKHLALRLAAAKTDVAATLVRVYEREYPEIDWSFKDTGAKEKAQIPTLIDGKDLIDMPSLTPANIEEELINRIRAKNPVLVEAATSIIKEVISSV